MIFKEFSWNYSDGIIISAVFLPLAPVWLVTFLFKFKQNNIIRKIKHKLKLVHLYIFAINLHIFLNNYPYILLNYTLYDINVCNVIYTCIVYFVYAISTWSTISKYYLLMVIIYVFTLDWHACDSYSFFVIT